MELLARDRLVTFPRRPLLMGILNINDDSFSGDGRLDSAWAMARAREMAAAGADIIDVGGESARTNREAISAGEELRRIQPFIENSAQGFAGVTPRDAEQLFPPLLSINTWRPQVARPALAVGGHLLNDMSGLPDDENARICAETGAALLIMHSVGAPKVPHTHVGYTDIVTEMKGYFREKISMARAAGVREEAILLDPGIDFAKQAADNLRIYRELAFFREFGRPVLLPVSRKSVIGHTLGIKEPTGRDAATAACIVSGMLRGAHIFRVHNVEMAWQTIASTHRLQLSP